MIQLSTQFSMFSYISINSTSCRVTSNQFAQGCLSFSNEIPASWEISSVNSFSESLSVVSDSLRPHRLYSPWNSPGQNTGMGSHSLLQGIFPTQGLNPGLLHCRQTLYQLSHQGQTRGFANLWLWILACPIENWKKKETDYYEHLVLRCKLFFFLKHAYGRNVLNKWWNTKKHHRSNL